MRNFKMTLAAATGLALTLAACGDEPDVVAEDEVAMADQTMAEPVAAEFDPLSRDYVLSDEARERRTAFDMEAFNTEYGELRDQPNRASSGDQGMEGSGTTGSNGNMAASNSASGNMGSSMPSRSEMDWAYLDRNSDGRLSVAEYAIWAIPVDPNEPKPNDERKPYVTADQANRAADSFFYYDQDGDTYLSQSEFSNARRGADIG